MELRESVRETRERAGLARLPPPPVPPQFELPDLSGTEQSSDSGQHSSGWYDTLFEYQQRHRDTQDGGRAVVSSDDE
jgi:hypothetical protein